MRFYHAFPRVSQRYDSRIETSGRVRNAHGAVYQGFGTFDEALAVYSAAYDRQELEVIARQKKVNSVDKGSNNEIDTLAVHLNKVDLS